MKKMVLTLCWVLVIIMFSSSAVFAAAYNLSPSASKTFSTLSQDNKVQKGLNFIKEDHENTVAEQKVICEITSPPFMEEVRAKDYAKRLTALGIQDVKMDSVGNVFGLMKGTGDGPTLLVAAHLDTVFPAGTDTTVIEKDGKLYAPGIADDTRGLAALLSIVRAFNASGIKPLGDIIFCGDVGEEGLGDLRGVKALFRDNKDIDGFISIDGTGNTGITYKATGSHRYEVAFVGPGGHSFSAFGLPSSIHAMGRAIAKIGEIRTPVEPKTTFTVGTVAGGTSVNSIAADAVMLVDMRSNDENEVLKTEALFKKCVVDAVAEENARWNNGEIRPQITLVGDRPAGIQPDDSVIVQAAWAGTQAIGLEAKLNGPSSTDSNLPISLGIPAVTLGGGGTAGNGHSPSEWFDPTDAYLGPQRIFLTILGLVGADGISEPMLEKK